MNADTPTTWQSDRLRGTQYSAHKFMVYDKETARGFNALVAKVILRGEESDSAKLPKSMHIKRPEDDHEFFPDYLRMGFPVVSERFAGLLKKFDVGQAQFLPIDLYQSDRETLRPDKYFIMAIQSQKLCWVQEQSTSNAADEIGPDWWNYRSGTKTTISLSWRLPQRVPISGSIRYCEGVSSFRINCAAPSRPRR